MTEVALAVLLHDGTFRQICIGCTKRLIELQMVQLLRVTPLNDTQPEYVTAIYEVAPSCTMEQCRTAIADRHVGKAWGS
jgi:hypothetical protein